MSFVGITERRNNKSYKFLEKKRCVYKILVAFAQRCVYNKSVAFYTTLCI